MFATGLVCGFYSGMVGSGGNVILIPVLDYTLYYLGIRDDDLVKSIIAHSLMVSFFLGGIVAYRQYRENNFFLKEVTVTSLIGIVTATLTTVLITYGNWYRKSDFDIVFTFMLLLLILKLIFDKKSGLTGEHEIRSNPLLLGIGSLTGVITSMSGLGGGIILIPGFMDIMKMSLKKASSVSISVIAILALPISITYMFANTENPTHLPLEIGYISFTMVIPVLAGVWISAPYGVRASHNVRPQVIKTIFAFVVSGLLIKMVYQLV